jgi:preprotein translocase subunit SecE
MSDADIETFMAKINPGQFYRQVRQEVTKVTWPSRKETTISTVMVFVMVVLASIFFLLVDQFFAWGVKLIFGLGA